MKQLLTDLFGESPAVPASLSQSERRNLRVRITSRQFGAAGAHLLVLPAVAIGSVFFPGHGGIWNYGVGTITNVSLGTDTDNNGSQTRFSAVLASSGEGVHHFETTQVLAPADAASNTIPTTTLTPTSPAPVANDWVRDEFGLWAKVLANSGGNVTAATTAAPDVVPYVALSGTSVQHRPVDALDLARGIVLYFTTPSATEVDFEVIVPYLSANTRL